MKKILMVGLTVTSLSACSLLGMGEPSAVAELAPTQGNTARGTVTFTQQGDKVLVDATLVGLTPGEHAFHIHEKGDCSAPDGSSAGGHFNPTGKPHGDPFGTAHHLGDMPMLSADAHGRAKLYFELKSATLSPGPDSIMGRAVIVHQKPDDYAAQPSGNAGARVACGVIVEK